MAFLHVEAQARVGALLVSAERTRRHYADVSWLS
jgi:hypothetical protein